MPGFDGAGASDFGLAAGCVRGLRQWNFPVRDALLRALKDEKAEPATEVLLSSRDQGASMMRPARPVPLLTGAAGYAWQPGMNEARCRYRGDAHEPPVEYDEQGAECGCGLWAYWKLGIGNWSGSDVPVLGIIEGTGRVLIGELGFRCQKARIIALVPAFAIEVSGGYADPYSDRYRYGYRDDPYHYSSTEPGKEYEEEYLARARERATAWTGVIMEALGELYPEARVFATAKGMLASIPTGEITS